MRGGCAYHAMLADLCEVVEMSGGKRVDANQSLIVATLRAANCTVQDLHEVGKGCPDILIGRNEKTYVAEIKMPCAGLTPREIEWREAWRGQYVIMRSVEDVLEWLEELE